MNCELCGSDPEEIILLNVRQPDGKLNTFACYECAILTGAFCIEHATPHLGFIDNTTACAMCIQEEVAGMRANAWLLCEEITPRLRAMEKALLFSKAVEVTDNPGQIPVAIIRFITCKALRNRTTFERTMQQVKETGQVGFLFE